MKNAYKAIRKMFPKSFYYTQMVHPGQFHNGVHGGKFVQWNGIDNIEKMVAQLIDSIKAAGVEVRRARKAHQSDFHEYTLVGDDEYNRLLVDADNKEGCGRIWLLKKKPKMFKVGDIVEFKCATGDYIKGVIDSPHTSYNGKQGYYIKFGGQRPFAYTRFVRTPRAK